LDFGLFILAYEKQLCWDLGHNLNDERAKYPVNSRFPVLLIVYDELVYTNYGFFIIAQTLYN